MTLNSIAEKFTFSKQAISERIKIFIEYNLIDREKAGIEIYYEFNPEKMKQVDVWFEQFRKLWAEQISLISLMNY